jgi:hypothetical protein
LLAKVVNDNAGSLTPRGVLRIIAVGASLLAKVVNDNAGSLTPRGVLRFIASKLAPTRGGGEPCKREALARLAIACRANRDRVVVLAVSK